LNLLLIIIIFLILSLIFSIVLKNDEELFKIAYSLSLFVSVVGSFIIYRKVLGWAAEKWNLEEKLGKNLFPPRKK
ncbi:MAG: hypothetical protein PF447_00190, partial [Spirochaetaceae bacterium]|nr:hypothetical protein [Spirochaetaceae bacterium]